MSVTIGVRLTILRLSCRSYADFSISLDAMVDSGSILRELTSKTKRACVLECVSLAACKSVNFKSANGQCQLLERGFNESVTFLAQKAGWTYLTTDEEDPNVSSTRFQWRRQPIKLRWTKRRWKFFSNTPFRLRKTWETPFLAILIYFEGLEKKLSQASFL